MGRKLRSLAAILLMNVFLVVAASGEVKAETGQPMVDGSYLTHDNESVGYTAGQTRGIYLLAGYSKSARLGAGVLYAGGTTIAAYTVAEVGVSVMVERAQEGDTEWSYYEGWQEYNEDVDKISSNRRMDVEGGYYYRVRCIHSANGDVSSSFTDGVYIEDPILGQTEQNP